MSHAKPKKHHINLGLHSQVKLFKDFRIAAILSSIILGCCKHASVNRDTEHTHLISCLYMKWSGGDECILIEASQE